MNQTITKLLLQLKQGDYQECKQAAQALIEIGAPAVERLCEALHGKNKKDVRLWAAEILGSIGDRRAVKPLCLALQDDDRDLRMQAAEALGKLGDLGAVLPLCRLLEETFLLSQATTAFYDTDKTFGLTRIDTLNLGLKDELTNVRLEAAQALFCLGAPETLPFSVLAANHLTPADRFQTLEALQNVRFSRLDFSLFYSLPDIRQFCETALHHEDAAVRRGASEMLGFLEDQKLLRAGEMNETDQQELLRSSARGTSPDSPENLLRTAQSAFPVETLINEPSSKLRFWQRALSWFRRFKK